VALHQFHVAIISHMEIDAIIGIIDAVIGRLQQLRSLFTGHRAPLECKFPPCRAGTLDSEKQKDTRGRPGERQNSAKAKWAEKGRSVKQKAPPLGTDLAGCIALEIVFGPTSNFRKTVLDTLTARLGRVCLRSSSRHSPAPGHARDFSPDAHHHGP
jgi:hypothetical protein